MKPLALGLAVGLCAAGVGHAQHDMEHMHMMRRAANVKLEVQNDEAAHVLTLRLGPLNLPAHAGMNVAQAPALSMTVPFDGWFTGYRPSIVDETGSPQPGRLLHHVAIYNLARADFLCPSKPEHIFGAGGEMTVWPVTPGIGYRVETGDKIRVTTMFHNPTATSYPNVYLQVKIEYQPLDAGGPQLKSVYPAWIDVKECSNSSYDLKPGLNVTSGKFTLQYNGVLVGLGGHLHDYGRELDVVNETRHQEDKLEAALDGQGHIVAIPVHMFPGGFALAQGDVIKVTATYDNPTRNRLPDGAMGIAVGYFLPLDNREMAALRRSAAATKVSSTEGKKD
ncbi:MAG TPA: hypothetical protein VG028_11965 [Terriglobia bacterium]|nr:hypothetical protein [Terriglobia bacterium]